MPLNSSARAAVAHGCEPGTTYREAFVIVGSCWHMLLVVDVGNTQTHFGTFRGDELVEHWRLATVRTSTSDELGAAYANLLELRGFSFEDIDASIFSTVVPELEPEYEAMAEQYLR